MILVGARMRYAVQDRDGWPLAMLVFSTAAWKLAARERFMGWTPQLREKTLPLATDSPRFLNLPWIAIPCLGSHILAIVRPRTGPRGRRIGQARTDHFGPFVARRGCTAASQGNPSRKTRYRHEIGSTIHTKFMHPVHKSVGGVRTAAPERSGEQFGMGDRAENAGLARDREAARRTTAPSEAQAIRNWVVQAERDEGRRGDGPSTAEQAELRRLRREIRRLREECDILAKAHGLVRSGDGAGTDAETRQQIVHAISLPG